MESIRKPFQGIWNIIRFNWHYYIVSVFLVVLLLLLANNFNSTLYVIGNVLALIIVCSTLISLLVSFYIYDLSDLYKFSWMNDLTQGPHEKMVNINAGFDETSNLLKARFKDSELLVADFYDPTKHTEISIKRARRAYAPFPDTWQVSTRHLPLKNNSVHKIFTIFSAHEIRNEEERIDFFKELKRILDEQGQIIVTEHMRDTGNFLVYNIGFFHFHSKATWLKTFHSAGLEIEKEVKITPFITTFILKKSGTAF